MNQLFVDKKYIDVIEKVSIHSIEECSLLSEGCFQLEYELISNIDRYCKDVIDYLNNSDIEKLIFKKDLKHLELEYDIKQKVYILYGKKKNKICKLQIADIEWVYKNIYRGMNSEYKYAGNVYITYERKGFRNKKSYKLRKIEKIEKYICKLLKDVFSIDDVYLLKNNFINYKKTDQNGTVFYIKDKKYTINLDIEFSDKLKFLFNVIKEDIQTFWNIDNFKDFKMMAKKIERVNSYLLSNGLNKMSFGSEDENCKFIFSPFIKYNEGNIDFKVDITNGDFNNIFDNFIKLRNDGVYQLTDFKLIDYINNRDEVLAYIRLQMY